MPNLRGVLTKKEIPIVLGLLVILFFSGWYLWHKQQKDQAAEKAALAVPAGWTEYKNQKYDFRIIYPKSWQQPDVAETSGSNGKFYTISLGLVNPTGQKYQDTFAIVLDSSNYTKKVCFPQDSKQCSSVTAYSKADIDKALASQASDFIKSDSSSYTIYRDSGNSFGGLEMNQVVNLPKMDSTAAKATYYRWGDLKNCPKDKLAPVNQVNCLTESDYNTVNKVLKSLRVIPTKT